MKVSPNLLIAGFYKCGTTSLSKYLSEHHDICVPFAKELYHYIDRGSPFSSMNGVVQSKKEWSQGDISEQYAHNRGEKYYLDATPCYYSQNRAIEYAKESGAKVIFIIRNPADRLLSSFRFFKNVYQEYPESSYEDFISSLFDNGNKKRRYLDKIKKDFFKEIFNLELETGCYESHITRWINVVGKENVYIETLEQMSADPLDVMNKICKFLDISPEVYANYAFQAYMCSYEVRLPFIQRLGREIFKEDPDRYAQLSKYHSNFHAIKNNTLKKSIDSIYNHLLVKQEKDKYKLPVSLTERVREFYSDTNRRLLEKYQIDYS